MRVGGSPTIVCPLVGSSFSVTILAWIAEKAAQLVGLAPRSAGRVRCSLVISGGLAGDVRGAFEPFPLPLGCGNLEA